MNQEHFHTYEEPTTSEDELALAPRPERARRSAYEVFIDEQTIPIYRGLGMYDVRQLPLARWQWMGGQGSFIELDGQAGYFGMYAIEVPAGGVLNSERHMYEEEFLVIEGHGSTEAWREGSPKKQSFEWQPGTLFAVPLNVWHRLVNATSSPALVLVATSAPSVMELFPSRSYIFDNCYEFLDRYDESEDYFKPRDEIEASEERGRGWATLRTNLMPDIMHCYVPRAEGHSPGFRRVSPRLVGNTSFPNFIAEYRSGRYGQAHAHEAGRVLVCLRGKGYSLNWPLRLGKRPWEAGKGDLVNRQDYIPGGMVTAAPGSGDWFHQHFSTGKDAFRQLAFRHPFKFQEPPGEERELPDGTTFLGPGRHVVSYPEEDPQVRKMYQEALDKEGAEFMMPEFIYRKGAPPTSPEFGDMP